MNARVKRRNYPTQDLYTGTMDAKRFYRICEIKKLSDTIKSTDMQVNQTNAVNTADLVSRQSVSSHNSFIKNLARRQKIVNSVILGNFFSGRKKQQRNLVTLSAATTKSNLPKQS